ncbi:hypothetical protein [Desulfonema magnum]|uniref:Uncharacterized protein n=1 Tax=Desulfonema magnum TaxID=45655 RepID=A0A975BVZ7_9BACT|nr:hypothetical protein [Desulfonema magnum]QTA92776.1 Uncharacterized protein dnm_088660 [Desulfonema magnum]
MKNLETFSPEQISIVNDSASVAEEVVNNFYKMSASQWRQRKYDVKTLADLCHNEIVHGPFAQVIRYEGKRKDRSLSSSIYDFYKICLQDHAILSALKQSPDIKLFPFALYIITHELVHIVRFCKFLQNFDAPPRKKMAEETRVHKDAHKILTTLRVPGLEKVLTRCSNFFDMTLV